MTSLKTSKQKVTCRLRTGDQVIVTAGKSKGETGKIDRIDFKRRRIFVAGVNIYKRHTKPGGSNESGGIVDKVVSLDFSNVMLVDPKNNKPTRIGYRVEDKKKVRFTKSSGTILNK